jgi:DNA-binding MarR family transcriptional regulator
MSDQTNTSTDDIARQALDIVPFLMVVMASEMRATGHVVVGGHLRLLGILSAGPMSLTQLADLNMVSAPTMSNTVTALESRGWMRRVRAEHDRRLVMIELTPEGFAVYDEIETQTRRRITELLEPLEPHQREMLQNALGLLRHKFEAGLFEHLNPPKD